MWSNCVRFHSINLVNLPGNLNFFREPQLYFRIRRKYTRELLLIGSNKGEASKTIEKIENNEYEKFGIPVFYFTSLLLLISCSVGVRSSTYLYIPEQGLVSNEQTAIEIAETIWVGVYGDKIYDQRPFVVELRDNVWIVTGTLKTGYGGSAYIEIRRNDCRILKMYHGKQRPYTVASFEVSKTGN